GRLGGRPGRGRAGLLPPVLPGGPGEPALPAGVPRGRRGVRDPGSNALPARGGRRRALGRTAVPPGPLPGRGGPAGGPVRRGRVRRRVRRPVVPDLLVRPPVRRLARGAGRGVLRRGAP